MKTLDEMITVMQAAAAGKEIQSNWGDGSGWCDRCGGPGWNWRDFDYRIKPEPKRVPLGPEDVPPGSVFKRDSWKSWQYEPILPRETTVRSGLSTPVERGYLDMMNDPEAKISRDGGKTWQPCWKEA